MAEASGSDLAGMIGALALVIPPCRDQIHRLRVRCTIRRAEGSAVGPLHELRAQKLEARRHQFSAPDSLFTGLGAALLLISFWMSFAG